MDRQQELFSYLLVKLRAKGYTVYDTGAPGSSATYPYILLGDMQQVDTPRTKNAFFSSLYPTIHVYSNKPASRGTLSSIIDDIKTVCSDYANQSGILLTTVSTRVIPDNTTSVPLLHGIVEPTFER